MFDVIKGDVYVRAVHGVASLQPGRGYVLVALPRTDLTYFSLDRIRSVLSGGRECLERFIAREEEIALIDHQGWRGT